MLRERHHDQVFEDILHLRRQQRPVRNHRAVDLRVKVSISGRVAGHRRFLLSRSLICSKL
jgi:hypothetical protein